MVAGSVGRVDVVVLRDGRGVEVRRVGPGDEELILGFLRSLSIDTVYSRFFSLCPDLVREAKACTGDAAHPCFGLLALPLGQTFAVGHAGYWPLSPGWAEMAIAVVDDYRGLGLGGLLLGRLAEAARRAGIEVFRMDVLMSNVETMRLLRRSGFRLRARLGQPPYHGVIRCQLIVGSRDADPAHGRLDRSEQVCPPAGPSGAGLR